MGSNIKKDELARRHNKAIKSSVFTFYKKAVQKLSDASSSMEDVFSAIRKFESLTMRAARKHIIGAKSSSRKISSLVLKAKNRFNLSAQS